MKKKVNYLPLDFMKSVAKEKNGKLEVRKRPTETRILLVYPDCQDCIHWKKCGNKWKDLRIDTNKLAQKCEEYRKKENENRDLYPPKWKTHQQDHKRTKIGKHANFKM